MAHNQPPPVAPGEPAAGHGAGPLELGDGLGALGRPERGGLVAGHTAPAPGAARAPTMARVGLRGRGQTRRAAPSPQGGGRLWAAVALVAQPLAGPATGPGPRGH